jgi:hypothetical protein
LIGNSIEDSGPSGFSPALKDGPFFLFAMYHVVQPMDYEEAAKRFADQAERYRKGQCGHNFPMGLYIPPGRTVNVTCPHCHESFPVTGSGATC